MISVIVVFPKLEEAKSIKNLLVRNGIDVNAACTTGAQVINLTDDLDYGVVVSGYKMVDMMYNELLEYLPETFDMLLLASKRFDIESDMEHLECLSMPLKAGELIRTVNQMYDRLYHERKKKKSKPAMRTDDEKEKIKTAKNLLMKYKCMTEDQAHKYLQHKSMDKGMTLVDTANEIVRKLSANDVLTE